MEFKAALLKKKAWDDDDYWMGDENPPESEEADNTDLISEGHNFIYHGTSSVSVDHLVKEGVKGDDSMLGRSFYGTLSERIAWEEAKYTVSGVSKGRAAGGTPVVVVFDLRKFHATWYEDVEYRGGDSSPHAYWTMDGIPASAIVKVMKDHNGTIQ